MDSLECWIERFVLIVLIPRGYLEAAPRILLILQSFRQLDLTHFICIVFLCSQKDLNLPGFFISGILFFVCVCVWGGIVFIRENHTPTGCALSVHFQPSLRQSSCELSNYPAII